MSGDKKLDDLFEKIKRAEKEPDVSHLRDKFSLWIFMRGIFSIKGCYSGYILLGMIVWFIGRLLGYW
jgi:accessory gene regulator protein AgrB